MRKLCVSCGYVLAETSGGCPLIRFFFYTLPLLYKWSCSHCRHGRPINLNALTIKIADMSCRFCARDRASRTQNTTHKIILIMCANLNYIINKKLLNVHFMCIILYNIRTFTYTARAMKMMSDVFVAPRKRVNIFNRSYKKMIFLWFIFVCSSWPMCK